ncbi:MAG: hypothetical protein M3295_06065, partial [Chloroflexota bacterium]|nr:hypothetical protein [Chloroflexota bacterium]
PALRGISDALRARLDAAGFDRRTVSHAESAIMGYVVGATLWRIRNGDDADRAGAGDDEFEFGLDLLLAGLDARASADKPVAARG